MDGAYLLTLSALAGSSIGAFSTPTATWLNQSYQRRIHRISNEMSSSVHIFGELINDALRAYGDDFENGLDNSAEPVKLYSINIKIRLFLGSRLLPEPKTL